MRWYLALLDENLKAELIDSMRKDAARVLVSATSLNRACKYAFARLVCDAVRA